MGNIEKNFEGHLLLNWKTGEMAIVKRKPKKLNPFIVIVKTKIKVIVPEVKEIIAEGEVIIPAHQVKEMTVHSI